VILICLSVGLFLGLFLPARSGTSYSYDPVSAVCVFVANWRSIETSGRIKLAFGMGASFDLPSLAEGCSPKKKWGRLKEDFDKDLQLR